MSIYIALLSQKSNALNTQASTEKPGFQSLCKRLIVLLCVEVVCVASSSRFQTMGLCMANARQRTVDSQCHGTTISCCVADLRRCLPTTSVTGVQRSTRYCGALPCRHLCMMTPSLYVTRSATLRKFPKKQQKKQKQEKLQKNPRRVANILILSMRRGYKKRSRLMRHSV